jgi:hypothetical protein
MTKLIIRAHARRAWLFGRQLLGTRALALALTPIALGVVGCTAEVTTRPAVATVQEDVVVAPAPVNVYAYPHTVYRGESAYYVDGRWYQRRGSHSVYYRHEPPDLVRHRGHVEVAPPAPRQYPPPGEAIRVR